ncbi:MAG TPA: M56 family metallopeptidase, partial [Vicinamibacterales bacterium]|nr:M56 family metallopeptidase [Vicinamibacterales bacterium]
VNIFQMTAETLLFHHPAIWWVSHRMRVERELCCDDEAVKLCGNAAAYARALVTMARQQVPMFAMGSGGGSVTDRVRRLLGIRSTESHGPVGTEIVAVSIALALAGVAAHRVHGQSQPLRFEVASRQACRSGRATRFSGLGFLPGGVVSGTQVPILAIIATAYDLPWRQVEGPDDLMKEKFAIDAKAPVSALPPEGATFDETLRAMAPLLREMLKTLLAERFKLAGHTEKREVPLYALVVGSKGPKLKPADRDCAPKTATDDPCGGQGGGPAGGLRLRGAEVAMLAEMLNSLLDRPVVDRTGIKGRYDIDLPSWNPGLPLRDQSPDPDPEPQPDPNAPSISTVLQALGLRLEPIRGPLDIYVVDHMERPTAN